MKKLKTIAMYLLAIIVLGGWTVSAHADVTDYTSKYGQPLGCRVLKIETVSGWDSAPNLYVLQCPQGVVGTSYEYRSGKTTKRADTLVIPNQDSIIQSALQKLTPQERRALGY